MSKLSFKNGIVVTFYVMHVSKLCLTILKYRQLIKDLAQIAENHSLPAHHYTAHQFSKYCYFTHGKQGLCQCLDA